ncbi:MAG: hypothetical protein O3A55_02520 [Bacteroidetes bacterium]|nr:hypothetical protein [Bacteroidota bacterium]
MKFKLKFYISVFTILFISNSGLSDVKNNGKNKPLPTPPKMMVSEYKFLDGNTLNCTISSEGPYCDYRKTGNSGLEWPKGSGKTPIFTAGIWLGGVHRPTKQIRISNMDYTPEYQPGPLLETYNTSTNVDTNPVKRAKESKYRLYKTNKKDTTGTTNNTDYNEWPGDLGAPFIDMNGNNTWDKGIDKVKYYGDQQMWSVVNDVVVSSHANLSTSQPMGVEIQNLYFSFNSPGALGNIMFMKWKIINKSDADYDSVFIGMWSDPDLGDANDDLPGVDTLLSLGYLYNGDNNDGTTHGYGEKPPAVGFDFFQGPSVSIDRYKQLYPWINVPTDTFALFDGQRRPGKINLPASSFVVYCNGTFAQLQDPPDKNADYILQAYDYLNGKAGTIHQWVTHPSGRIIKYFFSGDPVTGTGDLPANFPLGNFAPQDVRIMISTGPFTLAKGDTQEIVGAIVMGQGTDRLNSITALKQADKIAQDAFNDNFQVPSAPPLPTVKVSELPNKIVIDWSTNSDKSEKYNFKGYEFQGYNLYQGQSQNGPWKRLFTYDLVDGIKLIEDYQVDPITGNPYNLPVAYGEDTGLKYYTTIDKDYLTGSPLIPGRKYYFALTTYAYNKTPGVKGTLPLVLENAKEIIGVGSRNYITPILTSIGTSIPTTIGQVLSTDRPGDDAVRAVILQPTILTNSKYKVTFNGTGTNVTGWNLLRAKSTSGFDTLIKNSTDFTGGDNQKLSDGFILKIINPDAGPRRDSQTPKGVEYKPSANVWFGGAGGGGFDAFDGGVVYPRGASFTGKQSTVTADQLKKVEIRFSTSATQQAFRYVGNLKKNVFLDNPVADPSFTSFIVKKAVGSPFQDMRTINLQAFEVDQTDGSAADRQLNVAFMEWNDSVYTNTTPKTYVGRGSIDGKWDPTTYTDGAKEYLVIFNSDYNPNSTFYKNSKNDSTQSLDLLGELDQLDVLYIIQIKKLETASTFSANDKFIITPNYRLNSSRTFNFLTTAPVSNNLDTMKSELNKINVYPNPYFAHNNRETSPLQRMVTFTKLPKAQKLYLNIYNLAGELVKTLTDANVTDQGTANWDLRNENGLPVASGMYLIHINIDGVGMRIMKLAIIQPEERPGRI